MFQAPPESGSLMTSETGAPSLAGLSCTGRYILQQREHFIIIILGYAWLESWSFSGIFLNICTKSSEL